MSECRAIDDPIETQPCSAPRWRLLALLGIMLVGLMHGLFWAITYPVPWGDEAAHLSYIQSVASGRGVPVTGKSYVSSDALALLKENRAGEWRTIPAAPTPSDPRWRFDREQYEGYQTPLYYFAMTPFYWIGRTLGPTGTVIVVRFATLLVTLAAIPLLYAMGKELFPAREVVWLLAPALLVTMQMFNAYAIVSNDGIMVGLGALCVLALLRLRRGLTPRRAVMFGAACGLCALGKGTAMGLLPLLALGLLGVYVVTGCRSRQAITSLAIAGGVLLLLVMPWIAFNLHVYHAISGGKQEATLVGPIIGRTPVNLAGAHKIWTSATRFLFVAQDAPGRTMRYRQVWAISGIGTTGAAVIAAAFRRSLKDLMIAGWLAISLPIGVLTIILVTFSQSGTGTTVLPRHLGVLLPVLCLAMAYGAASLGPRLGAAVLVILLVLFSWAEIGSDQAWVRSAYTKGLVGKSAPVVDQSYTDGVLATATSLTVVSGCPVTHLSFFFPDPPTGIAVNARAATSLGTSGAWTTYQLAMPTTGTLNVDLPAPTAVYLARPTEPAVALAGSPDVTPVARVYCVVGHPASFRFRQTFWPQHPFGVTLRMVLDWPIVEMALGIAAASVVLVCLAMEVRRRRVAN